MAIVIQGSTFARGCKDPGMLLSGIQQGSLQFTWTTRLRRREQKRLRYRRLLQTWCCLAGAKKSCSTETTLHIWLNLKHLLIGTRLMNTITDNNTVTIKPRVMWSDSCTVLSVGSKALSTVRDIPYRRDTIEKVSVADWRSAIQANCGGCK